jgi:ribosome-binding protein aMBF1 (putative translation factor)
MKRSKVQQLTAAGWRVGSVKEFLSLSEEEASIIEMKLSLAEGVKKLRVASRITQNQLAKRLRSSQSRVAKIESADPTVSIDLMVRTLLTLGATRREVGRIVGLKAKVSMA